jgi:lipoate-protein ligase A
MTDLSPTSWRLLITPPARGAWNMAVDEALLEAAGTREPLPTLRLYSWSPPALSIGYAQPSKDFDPDRLRQLGWEVVRRPTGGRAILHTDELTYSVIGPHDEPRLTGGVLESYRRLAQALLNALINLGLPAESQVLISNQNQAQDIDPVCFDVPSNYEITVQGKKLVGSAQSRKGGAVLQHGTLPLQGDLTRITQALYYPDQATRQRAAERLLERATTVEASLGKTITWDRAAQAFADAFAETLNLTLIKADLSSQEIIRAEALMAAKFDNLAWLKKR